MAHACPGATALPWFTDPFGHGRWRRQRERRCERGNLGALEEACFANLFKADYDGGLVLVHQQFLEWPGAVPQAIDREASSRFMRQLISWPTSRSVKIERAGIRVLAATAPDVSACCATAPGRRSPWNGCATSIRSTCSTRAPNRALAALAQRPAPFALRDGWYTRHRGGSIRIQPIDAASVLKSPRAKQRCPWLPRAVPSCVWVRSRP